MISRKLLIPLISGGAVLVGLAIFLAIFFTNQHNNEEIYQKANEYLYRYEFDESEELFASIYNYKDSAAKIGVIHGMKTLDETGNYNKAIEVTTATGGVIEVNFTSEGSEVEPITITTKTTIEVKSEKNITILEVGTFKLITLLKTLIVSSSIYMLHSPHTFILLNMMWERVLSLTQ